MMALSLGNLGQPGEERQRSTVLRQVPQQVHSIARRCQSSLQAPRRPTEHGHLVTCQGQARTNA